ncbi:acyl carrier protein [Nonomuraea aridisoli]|uniref:Actinorhodin polyketide synthase n=1 Tax=Nonomuraea aridisoli TaxID=2070368 RepID=A0A2W2EPP1_9ACTN|nr:acyl carrier protein [Nonomuraea aridisoli]PZG18719.1 actinorhodin polyketide synthase [Nonomuraea aridisoli]
MTTFTQDDLVRILREAAGESAEIIGREEIGEIEFSALGYDSLALLETAARIEREYGITLADDTFLAARTPRELIELVTSCLAGSR